MLIGIALGVAALISAGLWLRAERRWAARPPELRNRTSKLKLMFTLSDKRRR